MKKKMNHCVIVDVWHCTPTLPEQPTTKTMQNTFFLSVYWTCGTCPDHHFFFALRILFARDRRRRRLSIRIFFFFNFTFGFPLFFFLNYNFISLTKCTFNITQCSYVNTTHVVLMCLAVYEIRRWNRPNSNYIWHKQGKSKHFNIFICSTVIFV